MSALDLNFVQRQAHRLQRHLRPRARRPSSRSTRCGRRRDHGAARADRRRRPCPALPGGYQQHKSDRRVLQATSARCAPIKSPGRGGRRQPGQRAPGAEVRQQHPRQLRWPPRSRRAGRTRRLPRRHADPAGGPAQGHRRHDEQRDARRSERRLHRDPRHRPSGATAGTPQITIPMGYSATTRRARERLDPRQRVLSERNLIGVAYVIEQATKLRQPASELNPSMYRCAKTIPAPPFAARGELQPGLRATMAMAGGKRADAAVLARDRVGEEPAGADDRGDADGGDADQGLPRADRADERRGPGDPGRALAERGRHRRGARRSTRSGRRARSARPLHGIPVLLDDSIDVDGPADDRRLDRAAELDAGGRRDDRGQAQGGRRDHPRQDERLRAERPVRREHARGLLVARRPGAAAVRHRQDPRRLVGGLGGRDGLRPGGADRRAGDLDRHGAADRAGGRGRRRRPEADGRAGQPRGRAAGREVAGLARPDHADGATTRRRSRASALRPAHRPCRLPALSAGCAGGQADRRDRNTTRAVPGRGHRAPGASARRRPSSSGRHAEPEPAEHRRARVQARPERLPGRPLGGGAKSLQEIIDYNVANPVEG